MGIRGFPPCRNRSIARPLVTVHVPDITQCRTRFRPRYHAVVNDRAFPLRRRQLPALPCSPVRIGGYSCPEIGIGVAPSMVTAHRDIDRQACRRSRLRMCRSQLTVSDDF